MRPNDAAAQISTNVRFAPKAVGRRDRFSTQAGHASDAPGGPSIFGGFALATGKYARRQNGKRSTRVRFGSHPDLGGFELSFPISKNAFEMSAEFPLFWPKIRLGDFCSCKLWSCPVLVRLFGAIATAVLVDLRRCLCRLREGPSSGSFPLCFGGCRWSQTRVLAACISRDRPQ